ncbi:MAG TPA: DJ-1/PfpI family protein [Patescibacteria group bacterium]|nr:DJ-1/PfpI family protein [Patescibacteria group bacterium]
MTQLQGKKIMILVANGVDESVMSVVMREMTKSGAVVKTVGTETGLVNSWNDNAWGLYFPVDMPISQTLGADFDCLMVLSGTRCVQKLSTNAHSERIITSFIMSGKPMAFIGNAVELLAKINLASGWNVAGPEASQAVMTAAGATWAGNGPTVHNALLTGEGANVIEFLNDMTAHFNNGAVEIKAAA